MSSGPQFFVHEVLEKLAGQLALSTKLVGQTLLLLVPASRTEPRPSSLMLQAEHSGSAAKRKVMKLVQGLNTMGGRIAQFEPRRFRLRINRSANRVEVTSWICCLNAIHLKHCKLVFTAERPSHGWT
jgi:hypothetical protein